MRKYVLISAALLALGAGTWATTEVATLSCPGPFELRGASVTPGQGVPAWPALAGDKIASQETPVTFTFGDGSLVTLGSSSQASIEMSGRTPVFRLQSGTAHYSLKSLTAVKLMALNTIVSPAELSGRYGLDPAPQGATTAGGTPAMSSGVKAAIALSAFSAAASFSALGYSVSQGTGSGSPVSSSK